MKKILLLSVLTFSIVLLFNCRPERVYIEDRDARLVFTEDTIFFDTIFTTVGTITRSFRVHNPHDRFIKIDEVELAGGENSMFRINVDGAPGISYNGLEIAPHDSMYVFVEATLDSNNSPDILRIQDSITFRVNDNLQDVDLVAWGQDVIIFRDSIFEESVTFTNEKPYLIVGAILIDTLQTLTMEPGVTVYMHRDSWILVSGTLKMLGSLEEPITIQGDRLEMLYEDIPGQWGGIYCFAGSFGNEIHHSRIINGTVGLVADSVVVPSEPNVYITNTEINQMSHDGILARGTTLIAENLVIGDCGNSCMELLYEGSYSFTHCTFANYWRNGFSNRNTPALFMANYFAYEDNNGVVQVEARDIEEASFKNCIIYGDRPHELVISYHQDGVFNYSFDYCLTRIDRDEFNFLEDDNFKSITNNTDPLFDSLRVSYELDTLSPAIDMGLMDHAINLPYDKKGDNRLEDGAPDLGAYERIE